MRILAAISKNEGSTYYRIRQPSVLFDESEIQVKLRYLLTGKFKGINLGQRFLKRVVGTSWDYAKLCERTVVLSDASHFDAVWICRSMLSFPNRIDASLTNVIYDFDDSIWIAEAKHCFERYCKTAKVVLAGNDFLANRASTYSNRVAVVPTSVDLNAFKHNNDGPRYFTVGWIGSSAGFRYLKNIEVELIRFCEITGDARFLIVSERYPVELVKLSRYIDYVPWSREMEYKATSMMSIGIMPLESDEWDLGKCSYKMLHYMAAQIPVVVSDFGMNKDVLKHQKTYGKFGLGVTSKSEWVDALLAYYHMSDISRRSEGVRGCRVIEHHYSAQVVSKMISEAFGRYI